MNKRVRSISESQVDRFLRALHRRLVLLRGLERMGQCLLIGCGGAALLMPIVWWRGGPMLAVTAFILAMSCGIGLLMAALRRPTALDAALLADHQLQLHDLLGTALLLRWHGRPARVLSRKTWAGRPCHPTADPWCATVLALADARCRDLSPSSVLLHRWGSRAWAGVGLVAALVITVAGVFSRSTPTQADVGGMSVFDRQDDLGLPRLNAPSSAYSESRQPMLRTMSRDSDDLSANPAISQTADATTNDASAPKDAASVNRHSPYAGDPTGTGAGSSATLAPHSTLPHLPSLGTHANAIGQGSTASGGQADSHPDGGQDKGTLPAGLSGTSAATPSAPPWSRPTWPADQRQAIDQIQAHPTYDPYRDLIRDYFERR